MTRRQFAGCLFGTLASAMPARAEALPVAERQRIEELINHLESLKGSSFIRNGKRYDASQAGRFLRAKWNKHANEIHSAEDFIAKAASASSTTGQAYRIRFADGHETPCGDYLRGRLTK